MSIFYPKIRFVWLPAMLAHAVLGGLLAGIYSDYSGKPFADSTHSAGAQVILGRMECAYFHLGGEGVAYHDTDPTNHGSAELNFKPEHHRPHTNACIEGIQTNQLGRFRKRCRQADVLLIDDIQFFQVDYDQNGRARDLLRRPLSR